MADEFHHAGLGMAVILERGHMAAQMDDPFAQERDLDLGRARIGRMDSVLMNEVVFLFFRQQFMFLL
jgi:hypothetical protein